MRNLPARVRRLEQLTGGDGGPTFDEMVAVVRHFRGGHLEPFRGRTGVVTLDEFERIIAAGERIAAEYREGGGAPPRPVSP